MRVVDFFSGIGGFSLGLERAGFQTVAFSEIDPYACAVLKKHWPDVPNLGDIRSLDYKDIPEADVFCGGFPCQGWSLAGRRLLDLDQRNLWPSYFRAIEARRPRWIVAENVPAIGDYSDAVLGDLENAHYETLALDLPAVLFGARQERFRRFFVARAHGVGRRRRSRMPKRPREEGIELERLHEQAIRMAVPAGKRGRMSDGVSHRVDRLRCLGNAIVPQIATWIGERIMEAE